MSSRIKFKQREEKNEWNELFAVMIVIALIVVGLTKIGK